MIVSGTRRVVCRPGLSYRLFGVGRNAHTGGTYAGTIQRHRKAGSAGKLPPLVTGTTTGRRVTRLKALV